MGGALCGGGVENMKRQLSGQQAEVRRWRKQMMRSDQNIFTDEEEEHHMKKKMKKEEDGEKVEEKKNDMKYKEEEKEIKG